MGRRVGAAIPVLRVGLAFVTFLEGLLHLTMRNVTRKPSIHAGLRPNVTCYECYANYEVVSANESVGKCNRKPPLKNFIPPFILLFIHNIITL